jgi:hypothetical protein
MRLEPWLKAQGFEAVPGLPRQHDKRITMHWQRDSAIGWHRLCVQVMAADGACRAWVWWSAGITGVQSFVHSVQNALQSANDPTGENIKLWPRASFNLAQNLWQSPADGIPDLQRGQAVFTERAQLLRYAAHLVNQCEAQLKPFWAHFEDLSHAHELVNAAALNRNVFLADAPSFEAGIDHAILAHLVGSPKRDEYLAQMEANFAAVPVNNYTAREREIAMAAAARLKQAPLPAPHVAASLAPADGLQLLMQAKLTHADWAAVDAG